MPTDDRDSSPEPDYPIEEEEEVEEEVEEGEEEEVEEEEVEGEVEEEEEEMEVDEEEEEVEEKEEVEEEEDDDEGVEAGDEEKDKDTSKKLESEEHVEDLKLVSSTPGRSESIPATPRKDAIGGSFVACDSSVKIRVENNKEAPNINVADVGAAVQGKHISSEERGCSGSLADEKEITVHLGKKMHEDPEHAKNFYIHAHGSGQAHLNPGDSICSENTATLQVQNNELAENMLKGGSASGKSDDILEKEVSQLHSEAELKMLEESSLSSMHTPQRRPRSSSPAATPENSSKRPAILCAFYARGWCIKGNSCLFLHQKEGSKEDLAEPNKKEDVLEGTGCREEVERSRISSSQERPDSSNTESSSKSQLQIQRDLVRAYGGDNHDPPHIHDGHNMCAGVEFHKVDTPQVGRTLIQDEYKSPLGVSPRFDYMDERRSSSEHLSSSRYLHEEQMQREMPKREFLNDLPFSRGSSLTKSSAVPEHRYYSGTSSTSSSFYFSNNNPFAHDKRTEDFAFQNYQSRIPLHGSHSSYSLGGSFSSTFNSSYQLAPAPSFSSERPDTHKTFDLDKEYHNSMSTSLPRSSSPFFSRPEVENGLLRSVPRDLQPSVRQKTETQENPWEPSVPFRPSFHYVPPSLSSPGSQYDPLLDSLELCNTGNIAVQASERTINVNVSDRSNKGDPLLYGSRLPQYNVERTLSSFPPPHEGILNKSKRLSSPGSQYDPLLDSIEPSNTGNIAVQVSERTINLNISDHSNKGDPLLYGSHLPVYNVERTLSSFPPPHEGILDKSTPADGLSRETSLVANHGHTAVDGVNNYVLKYEEHSPDHLVESANINDVEHGGDLKHQGDKSKINKESKTMKIFRAALVDFVKELVKPSWREGHLSKDAHKKVVKKAVEKVLGALQTHQIPNTTESINQYLSTSRPKLLKLVEGYVEKYNKY